MPATAIRTGERPSYNQNKILRRKPTHSPQIRLMYRVLKADRPKLVMAQLKGMGKIVLSKQHEGTKLPKIHMQMRKTEERNGEAKAEYSS